MENTIELTTKQQFWLDHITRAKELGISLSSYAKQENINLKALYNYQSIFRKKGIADSKSRFARLTPASDSRSLALPSTIVRVTLLNGICIELPITDNGIEQLLQKVSKL